MTKDTDNTEADPAGVDPKGPLAGERLAAARRDQQITVSEVAKELHLDEAKVRALENNQFDVLGAPVFAKGHLRKYARLVDVSVEDMLADYYALNRTSGMPPVVGKVRKPAREFSPGPWFAAIAAMAIVMIAYWWFVVREAPVSNDSDPAVAVESLPGTIEPDSSSVDPTTADVDGTEDSADVDLVESTDSDTTLQAPVTVREQEAEAPEPAATPLPAGEVRLILSFSGDCWTEITDAGGRRLFFDLGSNGRNVSVSGRAPLSVLFGNANNVSVTVNGSDYQISPSDRRGQTARLTITAP